MRRWPWFTMIATAVFFISPFGSDLIYLAFYSGERLSNTLAQFMLEIVAAIVIAFAVSEWGIKFYIRKRRSKGATSG